MSRKVTPYSVFVITLVQSALAPYAVAQQLPLQDQAPYYGNAQYQYGDQFTGQYNGQYGERNGLQNRYSPYIPAYSANGNYQNYAAPGPYSLSSRMAFAPAGLVIPVTLSTSISTQVAHAGDYVQASVSENVALQGGSYIPAGSMLIGEVTDATAGRIFDRSGLLSMKFDQLRLLNGNTVPVQAHILGNIANYAQKNGAVRGEGWGTKLGNFALRGAIGAGSGAVFGTALGAIAGDVGRGAWAGTAIGGGIGLVDDLVLRRGRNVLIQAGTPMQIQLDAPLEIPIGYDSGNG